MKKNKSKYLWYLIGITVLLLFIIILIASILDLGEKIRKISKYLEYGFYGIIFLLIIFGIIRPIIIIVGSPSLKIASSIDNPKKQYRIYKKVAKNIIKNNDLNEEEIKMLKKYKSKEELLLGLNFVFENHLRKDINKIIISHAKTVLISTAICQSSRFDLITSFTINLSLIKDIVLKLGFRPSMKNLSKLSVNVFSTALIADGLDELSFSDIMPKSIDIIKNIPFLDLVVDSVLDGILNALLTIRIGCVARRYIYNDGNIVTKEDIRKNAYKEAMTILPEIIYDTISFFPKRIVRFFNKPKKEDNN